MGLNGGTAGDIRPSSDIMKYTHAKKLKETGSVQTS